MLTNHLVFFCFQTICPGLTTKNSPPQIYVSNQPLPETKEERAKQIDEIEGLMRVVVAGFPLASNILFAASYLASCFGFFPVYETVTKAKHLQFVSGVKLGKRNLFCRHPFLLTIENPYFHNLTLNARQFLYFFFE